MAGKKNGVLPCEGRKSIGKRRSQWAGSTFLFDLVKFCLLFQSFFLVIVGWSVRGRLTCRGDIRGWGGGTRWAAGGRRTWCGPRRGTASGVRWLFLAAVRSDGAALCPSARGTGRRSAVRCGFSARGICWGKWPEKNSWLMVNSNTRHSPWVETGAFPWRVAGDIFCLRLSIKWAFCPCGLPLIQLRPLPCQQNLPPPTRHGNAPVFNLGTLSCTTNTLDRGPGRFAGPVIFQTAFAFGVWQ